MSPRKTTPAQFRSAVQRAQRAVDQYNREARRHNASLKQAISNYNREVRTYNSKVRQYNQRVESQQRRLNQEIRRLQSRPTSTSFTTVRTTTTSFVTAYGRAETELSGSTGVTKEYLDLASDEAANSVYLLNALDGDGNPDDDMSPEELAAPSLATELARFGSNIMDRWTGALFSLSPQNPDAARHFCTSAREVVISILDTSAPDEQVIRRMPDCELTDKKVPTRRAKVTYLLREKGVDSEDLADAVVADMDNVLSLFRVFNDGTHGHAGRFSITELTAIRTRVEGAVAFLSKLTA